MELSGAVRTLVCVIFALAFAQALLAIVGLLLPLGHFAPVAYALLTGLCFWAIWGLCRP